MLVYLMLLSYFSYEKKCSWYFSDLYAIIYYIFSVVQENDSKRRYIAMNVYVNIGIRFFLSLLPLYISCVCLYNSYICQTKLHPTVCDSLSLFQFLSVCMFFCCWILWKMLRLWWHVQKCRLENEHQILRMKKSNKMKFYNENWNEWRHTHREREIHNWHQIVCWIQWIGVL